MKRNDSLSVDWMCFQILKDFVLTPCPLMISSEISKNTITNKSRVVEMYSLLFTLSQETRCLSINKVACFVVTVWRNGHPPVRRQHPRAHKDQDKKLNDTRLSVCQVDKGVGYGTAAATKAKIDMGVVCVLVGAE